MTRKQEALDALQEQYEAIKAEIQAAPGTARFAIACTLGVVPTVRAELDSSCWSYGSQEHVVTTATAALLCMLDRVSPAYRTACIQKLLGPQASMLTATTMSNIPCNPTRH